MANGWSKWKKLRCVVEVKVPPESAIRTKDLIYQVQQAIERDEGVSGILTLPRDWHPNRVTPKVRVMHFGKVVQADEIKKRESKSD